MGLSNLNKIVNTITMNDHGLVFIQHIYFIEILLELFNCVTVLKYLILSFLFRFVYRSFNFQYKKYNFDLMIFSVLHEK